MFSKNPLLIALTTVCVMSITACTSDGDQTTIATTTPTVSQSQDSTPQQLSATAQTWLDAHNKYRRLHKAPDLKWSEKLAKSAQAFADTCPQGHSNTKYGENIAWGNWADKVATPVDKWYSMEEPKHNYTSNEFNTQTGHFTQMVWKGTTEVGCGYKQGCQFQAMKNGSAYVCHYNPAGNVIGDFTKNVLPKN